jgi:hypothetical protein
MLAALPAYRALSPSISTDQDLQLRNIVAVRAVCVLKPVFGVGYVMAKRVMLLEVWTKSF